MSFLPFILSSVCPSFISIFHPSILRSFIYALPSPPFSLIFISLFLTLVPPLQFSVSNFLSSSVYSSFSLLLSLCPLSPLVQFVFLLIGLHHFMLHLALLCSSPHSIIHRLSSHVPGVTFPSPVLPFMHPLLIFPLHDPHHSAHRCHAGPHSALSFLAPPRPSFSCLVLSLFILWSLWSSLLICIFALSCRILRASRRLLATGEEENKNSKHVRM